MQATLESVATKVFDDEKARYISDLIEILNVFARVLIFTKSLLGLIMVYHANSLISSWGKKKEKKKTQ